MLSICDSARFLDEVSVGKSVCYFWADGDLHRKCGVQINNVLYQLADLHPKIKFLKVRRLDTTVTWHQ